VGDEGERTVAGVVAGRVVLLVVEVVGQLVEGALD
jgi:hypothetical protein